MNGDVLIHAVEVKEYVRVLPNGKRVVVKGYRRQGNAAQDDLNRRVEAATRTHNRMVRTTQKKYEVANNKFNSGNGRDPYRERTEMLLAQQARNKAIRKERGKVPTVQDTIRFAATDAYETVQVAVGNLFEDLKARNIYATDVMGEMAKNAANAVGKAASSAAETVKKAVSDGYNAVSSFFARLFGRR